MWEGTSIAFPSDEPPSVDGTVLDPAPAIHQNDIIKTSAILVRVHALTDSTIWTKWINEDHIITLEGFCTKCISELVAFIFLSFWVYVIRWNTWGKVWSRRWYWFLRGFRWRIRRRTNWSSGRRCWSIPSYIIKLNSCHENKINTLLLPNSCFSFTYDVKDLRV